MALIVLSMAALAIMIAFSTSISASQEHREIATANIVLANYSQQAIAQIEQTPGLFGCGSQNQSDETTYVLDSVQNQITIPSNYGNYSGTVSNVEYWNAATESFQSACIPMENPPLEVTIQVSNGNGQTYTNAVVIDLPSGTLGAANDLSNGIISQLVFTSVPGKTASGSSGVPFSPQPVVSALDSNNEIVGSSYPFIQNTIESGPPGTSTITGCTANDPNGVATFTGCTITGPAGTYVVRADWNAGGIDSDPSGKGVNANTVNPLNSTFWQSAPTWYSTTFTVVVAASKDQVVFAPAPAGGASGATLKTQPTIDIDTTANPAKVDTTQTGQVTLSLTGGSLTGCASTNGTVTTSPNGETITAPVVAGSVALSGCKFSGAIFYNATASPQGPDATIYGITASFSGAVSASSQISVDNPGAATQLVFVNQPSGVSNSGSAATKWPQPFAVEIEDAFGNPAYTPTPTQVTVAFDTTDAVTETLKNCTQSMVTDSAIATFTGCNGTAYGGGLKLKASYGNPAITQDSQPFSISASAGSLVFTQQPVAGQSGSAMTTQPIVEVLDNLGNVDTGFNGPVALAPSGGLLSGCTGSTPNLGLATFQACLFAGNPGTPYTLTASINSGAIFVKSAPFSPSQAGAATQVVFTTQPAAGAVAGSLMATQPVVKIEDSQGNVVTSSSATIALTSSGGTLAGCSNLTAVLGVVNVSNCTFGGLIGSQYTLTATSPGLLPGQSASFASNTVAGLEAGVLISANPTSVPASNVTNTQLTIQVVDNWGNATVSNGDTALTVSSSSTGGFFNVATGQSGPLNTSTAVTIPSGDPSAALYYGDETIGAPTITAYDSGTVRAFGSTSLSITPGAPTQLVYSNPPPTTITAGTQFIVAVTEEDQFNNVVSTDNSSTVTLAASNGTSNGGFTCTSTSAVVKNGVATFQNCSYTSTSTNAYVLTASSTGLASVSASTTVSSGPPTKVTVWNGNNQSAKTGAAFAAPLSALVTDSSGNPVSGVTVTFTSPTTNGATGKFVTSAGGACGAGTAKNSCTAVTNAGGVAVSSTLTAFAATGTYNVTAAIGTGPSANFSETNTNPTLAFLTAVQNFATTSTSAGTSSGSMIIQAQDGNGNPVIQSSNLSVILTYTHTGTLTFPTTTPNPTTVTIPQGSSNAVFTVAVSSATTAGTLTITAAAPGYANAPQTETVKINAAATATLTVTSPPTTVVAGSNAAFSVAINNGGNLWYSVNTSVNGLLGTGEGATASTSCKQIGGVKTPIGVTVNTSANRPSGPYTLDFIVESFGSNRCNGTPTYFQAVGTFTVASSAGTIAVNNGYGQATTIGAAFGTPLSVDVTDGNGNPVVGAVVTFTAPTNGASGTFFAMNNGSACVVSGTPGASAVVSCTAATNTFGVASSLTFTANSITGAYALQATTPGPVPNSATFEEENQ
jgi:hypothetical protein